MTIHVPIIDDVVYPIPDADAYQASFTHSNDGQVLLMLNNHLIIAFDEGHWLSMCGQFIDAVPQQTKEEI